jgi:hypothetical protein
MAAAKVDILVNLLTALQPFASNATTLPLNDADQPLDYSRLIGGMVVDHENRLSQLTSSLNTLYGYTTILQNQMATIIANGLVVPQISLPSIMPDAAYYNVEVVVSAIGIQLNTLRSATGTSTTLGEAVNYQNKIYTPDTLAEQTSLSSPPTLMSALTGWVATPTTAADAIKNMWITINDMRKAVQTTLDSTLITSCTSVIVNFTTYMDIPNNRITLFFLGNCTIPDGFIDTDANGASLRITDGSSTANVYTTYVNVSQANNSVSGITIDLTGTGINLYTNLTLLLTYSLTNGSLVCTGTKTNTVTSTGSPCVALTLTPLSTTAFTGVFTPAVVGSSRIVTYSITTYSNADCSTAISGSAVSYVNPTQNSLSYSVTSGLTTATTYYVRMSVAIGGNAATNCTVQTVKTL